ncbi:MAG: type IV pilus biogenesis/stability protein PilW [Methylovulum sp.]|jgi:type IV pilus assembly protein PilF|nr:type IV pilus biogenesis/stability protein PilW [Methylovulum sp.]
MHTDKTQVVKRCLQLVQVSVLLSLAACASLDEKSSTDRAEIYVQLGVRYLNMNRLDVAKANLEHALEENPLNINAHNALAFLYEKIEKYPQAKEHYLAALNIAPDDLSVQNNYGRFLCEHQETQAGVILLERAIKNLLNDRSWLALTNAGLCAVNSGQTHQAKAYFKQALLANERYAPALLAMQKMSYNNAEYWPAKGYLQRYLNSAAHTSESLWFGMMTERALGNQTLAQEYRDLLVDTFPLSKEAKSLAH